MINSLFDMENPLFTLSTKTKHSFGSDSDKFEHLDELLSFYLALEPILEADSASNISYNFEVTTHDDRRLWSGGAYGLIGLSSCHTRSGTIPYFSFLQDLVCLWALLDVSNLSKPNKTDEAEAFNSRLLEYTINLQEKGFIAQPEVSVDLSDPEKGARKAWEELKYAPLSWPAEFILKLEKSYFSLVLDKKGLKGTYDSSRIIEYLDIAIG